MSKVIKHEEYVNVETGEVKKAITIIPEVRDKDFAKVFKLFSKKVLEDLGVMNGEAKLLLWFIGRTIELPIQSELWIPVDYKELSKELNISVISLKRYIKSLLELGYIEQFRRRNTTFRVNPEYVYKGILVKYKENEIDKAIKGGN